MNLLLTLKTLLEYLKSTEFTFLQNAAITGGHSLHCFEVHYSNTREKVNWAVSKETADFVSRSLGNGCQLGFLTKPRLCNLFLVLAVDNVTIALR